MTSMKTSSSSSSEAAAVPLFSRTPPAPRTAGAAVASCLTSPAEAGSSVLMGISAIIPVPDIFRFSGGRFCMAVAAAAKKGICLFMTFGTKTSQKKAGRFGVYGCAAAAASRKGTNDVSKLSILLQRLRRRTIECVMI